MINNGNWMLIVYGSAIVVIPLIIFMLWNCINNSYHAGPGKKGNVIKQIKGGVKPMKTKQIDLNDIKQTDLNNLDAFDYLMFVGFGLSPIEDGVDIGYEEQWFWEITAEDRYNVIEQRLAEELIKALEKETN